MNPVWDRRLVDYLWGYSSDPRHLATFVNLDRIAAGLEPLAWSEELAAAAQNHAFDMYMREYLDDTSPEGLTPTDRARHAGYSAEGGEVGELLSFGESTVGDVYHGWIESQPHREHILLPGYQVVGCGRAGRYWAANFGHTLD